MRGRRRYRQEFCEIKPVVVFVFQFFEARTVGIRTQENVLERRLFLIRLFDRLGFVVLVGVCCGGGWLGHSRAGIGRFVGVNVQRVFLGLQGLLGLGRRRQALARHCSWRSFPLRCSRLCGRLGGGGLLLRERSRGLRLFLQAGCQSSTLLAGVVHKVVLPFRLHHDGGIALAVVEVHLSSFLLLELLVFLAELLRQYVRFRL